MLIDARAFWSSLSTRSSLSTFALLVLLVTVTPVHAQTTAAEVLIRASNLESDDDFGSSVSIDGDEAIIGASGEDGPNGSVSRAGAAYIFERQPDGTWTETAFLRASNAGSVDDFGVSVSISEGRAIVGAMFEDGPDDSVPDSGAAYVFERQADGSWAETQILRASNAGTTDYFGTSVSIDADYAIVGAYYEGGVNDSTRSSGAAYIFERQTDGIWTEVSLLRASNAGSRDEFGFSVSIDASRAVVGARFEDSPNDTITLSGAAYIFERQSDGTWPETGLLRASNAGRGDHFGQSVAIEGNRTIVGANSEDGPNNSAVGSGAAYVFERQADGIWMESGLLRASNAESNDSFGFSVSIEGNRAIVGARRDDGPNDSATGAGAAYIFERQADGTWIETDLLRASNAESNDSFGFSVSIEGNRAIVGAFGEDGLNNSHPDAGAAYVFNSDASIAVVDGSPSGLSLDASITPGTSDNLVGVLEMSTNTGGVSLEGLSVSNSSVGTAGLTEATLYASSDQTLDPSMDTELSVLPIDRDTAPATFDFTGFTEDLTSTGAYFLIAIDVAADAPGTPIDLTLEDETSLGLTAGEIASVNGSSATGFTDLPLSTGETALPVEFADISAQNVDQGITLEWQTLAETGNDRFEVERRIDAEDKVTRWVQVGAVEAAGTTTSTQRYVFEDIRLPYDAETLSYRLKQVDVDGTSTYSKEVEVQRSVASGLELLGAYPNPARGQATVPLAVPTGTADAALKLYDVLGRPVQTLDLRNAQGRQTRTLDLADLAPGVYFLRLTGDGQTRTEKLTVVR